MSSFCDVLRVRVGVAGHIIVSDGVNVKEIGWLQMWCLSRFWVIDGVGDLCGVGDGIGTSCTNVWDRCHTKEACAFSTKS